MVYARMRRTAWLIVGCLNLQLVAGVLTGAVFELTNGDRISGELVERTEAAYVIDSPILGRVTIPVELLEAPAGPPEPELAQADEGEPTEEASDEADDAEESAELAEAGADEAEEKSSAAVEEAIASVTPAGSATTSSIEAAAERLRELEQIPQIAYGAWLRFWEDNALFRTLGRYYPLMGWNNELNIGFSLRSSQRDETRLDLRFATERRFDRHQLRFESRYEFGRSSYQSTSTDSEGNSTTRKISETTQDRLRGNLRYRFDYATHFFIQSDTRYTRDVLSSIEHQADELIGVGYRWLNDARMQGSVTPSIGIGYSEIGGAEDGWGWLGSLQQDFEFVLTERLKVTQEASITYSPGDEGNYIIVMRAGLENQMTQRLSLNLRYDFTYDDRIASDLEQRTDGLSLSFGAKF